MVKLREMDAYGPYGTYGSHAWSTHVGADKVFAVLDRDGYERLMNLEQLRQEGVSYVRHFMNKTADYGNRSVRAVAAVYMRKYDAFGGWPLGSLPEALQSFSFFTSPFRQQGARPIIYIACFDLTRSDWWIPVTDWSIPLGMSPK